MSINPPLTSLFPFSLVNGRLQSVEPVSLLHKRGSQISCLALFAVEVNPLLSVVLLLRIQFLPDLRIAQVTVEFDRVDTEARRQCHRYDNEHDEVADANDAVDEEARVDRV